MPDDVKPWWQSTTIWAGLGSFAVAGWGLLTRHPVSQADLAQGADIGGQLLTGVLAVLTIYGRLRAAKRIG